MTRLETALGISGSGCRRTEGRDDLPTGRGPRWIVASEVDRPELDRWCEGVGPAVYWPDPAGEVGSETRPVLVAWNVRVGGGSIGRLIGDLRTGRYTGGRPATSFVLLLQEVFRAGQSVPVLSAGARVAERIDGRPPDDPREGIDVLAKREGLALLYVPSMRNGTREDAPPFEDRGNAILSTIPLSDPAAIELPLERQRRVAVGASVSFPLAPVGGEAGALALRLCSVHLENRAPWGRAHRTLGPARTRQARALVDELKGDEHVVLGGDFNTWFGQRREGAIRRAREAFPLPSSLPSGPTHHWELGLNRQSDYVLFRLPSGWTGSYRRLPSTYGSDHFPLLAQIHPL